MLQTGILKLVVASVLLSINATVWGQGADRMNILFIAVDDLKPTLGCYGDPHAITPNIDALANRGIIFSSAYCQQAVCAPSRASLMTSRYPDQTRVEDLQTMMREVSPGITSLPEYLISGGYATSATGKIFDFRSVDEAMDAPSWSYPYRKHYDSKYYDPENGKPSYYYASQFSKDTIASLRAEAIELGVDVNTYVREHYHPSIESANVRYDGYVDGAILNAGIELLDEVAALEDPFFLGVGFHRPHLPFVAPQEFWDLYDRDEFVLPEFQQKAVNSPDIAYHNYDELRSYTDIPGSGTMTENKQIELIHGYYAATSYIDHLVGMLLEHLRLLGLEENTIIVLWGDHGWHLGDHDLWCKHSNFEQATRVPMIFSYPDLPNKGTVSEAPVEFTDIAPTLCELTGTDIPIFFEGESLLPVFADPDTIIREAALSQYPRWNDIKGYSLRDKRYRYTKWVYPDGSMHSQELYDYQVDPGETNSFHGDPEYADTRKRLDSMLMERIEIPSTQEHITFEIHGINFSGDTVALPGATAAFHGENRVTNETGIATFTHIAGEYPFTAEAKGYIPDAGTVHVTGDTLVSIYLSQDAYQVTFSLVQGWNDQRLSGAELSFGGYSGTTDTEGNVAFNGITFDSYTVTIDFLKDRQQIFEHIEIYSDTIIVLTIDQPEYAITIGVLEMYSGAPVQVADVVLNGVARSTDYQGRVSFMEISGEYPLEISKEYYRTLTESITVPPDTSLTFILEPTHASIKIWVKKDGSPVNNATVNLGNNEIVTSSLGLAKFENLPNQEPYTYMISKEGLVSLSGELFLIQDTSVTVEMVPVSVNPVQGSEGVKLFPSPVGDHLHMGLSSFTGIVSFKIYDNTGRLRKDVKNVPATDITIDITLLDAGLYNLVLFTESCIRHSRFLKIE